MSHRLENVLITLSGGPLDGVTEIWEGAPTERRISGVVLTMAPYHTHDGTVPLGAYRRSEDDHIAAWDGPADAQLFRVESWWPKPGAITAYPEPRRSWFARLFGHRQMRAS